MKLPLTQPEKTEVVKKQEVDNSTELSKNNSRSLVPFSLLVNILIFLLTAFSTYLVVISNTDSRLDKAINAKVEDYEKELKKLITTGVEINERNAKDSLRIVALISDFGVGSYYMQVIKGKILQKNKRVNIVDITHAVKSFDEIEGSWILHNATKHLPEETIIWGMVNQGAKLSDNSIFFRN